MKKLSLLVALAITSTFITPSAVLSDNNINSSTQEQEIKYYSPNSLTNLFKNFNIIKIGFTNEVLDNDKNALEVFNNFSNGNYNTFFNNSRTGNLASLKMIPKDEVILQIFSNTYNNKTPNNQTFTTQQYEKTISNTYSFSCTLKEKATVKTKFKVPFINETEMVLEISSEQNWLDSTTTTEKLTYSKQSIEVNPYSVGKISYIIKQGTYYNQGIVRIAVNLNDIIYLPILAKDSNGNITNRDGKSQFLGLNVSWIIKNFNELGFGDQMKLNSKEYSFFSTDNPENPTVAYVNLPITWESQGGNLDVTFEESSLLTVKSYF